MFAGLHAARGYHVVLQSVRGTFGSGGDLRAMVNEAADGADTVAWLRRQPWFTGRFATIGLSYLGFTQWALLMDPPPELAAAVITVGPHDFSASAWGTGSFTVNDFLGWSHMVAHQEDPGRICSGIRQLRAQKSVVRAAGEVPMGASGRALLGDGAPWWESWLSTPSGADPFWGPLSVTDALDRVDVPVLLLSGWQDLFLEQTLQQYPASARAGRRRRADHRAVDAHPVLIGGLATIAGKHWTGSTPTSAVARRRRARGRVRFFVAGEAGASCPTGRPQPPSACCICSPAAAWPTPRPTCGVLGELSLRPGRTDPHHRWPAAVPRRRLPRRHRAGGPRATCSASPATRSPPICPCIGNPVAELAHSSDNPHVDVFVRISEVDAKGRSRNVSDAYRRLDGTSDRPDTVRLELDAIAHRFRAGSRIRVLVAGGSHPRFARNLGTGEAMSTGSRVKPSTHEVHFGASRIVLPVGS